MCIIAYAPEGVEIQDKTIRTMFENNPDGAGIMWKPAYDTNVEIRKGFMTVDELLKAWHQIPVTCEKAIHCRIATSGKISVACCHPFPVRPKTSGMMAPVDSAGMALMHNGVFSFATPKKGMKAAYSDTMIFASHYLYPLQKLLDKECIQTLIEQSSSSRLLIFRRSAETIMLGSWQSQDGVFFSNGSYKDTYGLKSSKVLTPSSYGSYGGLYNYGGYDYSAYDTRYEVGQEAVREVEFDLVLPSDIDFKSEKYCDLENSVIDDAYNHDLNVIDVFPTQFTNSKTKVMTVVAEVSGEVPTIENGDKFAGLEVNFVRYY